MTTQSSSQAPTGIGVIGLGMMGRALARVCTQLPEARIVGMADVAHKAGRVTAEGFGAPYYPDAGELCARPEVDAVIVATPEDAHVAPCLAAIEHGKAVLVEKPLAATVADAQVIASAAAARGVPLLVGHVLRFTLPYILARQAIDEGRLGAVQAIQTRRLNGRNAQERLKGRCPLSLFLGVHDYDVARWLAGSEPARVYAEAQYGVLRGLGYDIEDTNWALITFRNGVLAACETGWILPPGHPRGFDGGLWIQGSAGRLDIDLRHQGLMLSTDAGTTFPDGLFMPEIGGEITGGFVAEVRHFLACIRQGLTPCITAADAIAAVRIAEAVTQSARTHRPVEL